jgi:hypothetical protein
MIQISYPPTHQKYFLVTNLRLIQFDSNYKMITFITFVCIDISGAEYCVHMSFDAGQWNNMPCDYTNVPQLTLCEVNYKCA